MRPTLVVLLFATMSAAKYAAKRYPDVKKLPVASGGGPIPAVGYGLYQIPADESEAATLHALSLGYRHLDSASFYANEAGVGRAIVKSEIPRSELYVASKVWTDCIGLGAAAVRSSILKSLELLQVQYLDLAYVHWPVPGKHVEAYEALEALVREGKVKAIGLSNYRVADYEELFASSSSSSSLSSRIQPAVNQIEVNPFLFRKDAIDFFRAKGILIVAYKPLLRGKGVEDARVGSLAAKLGTTPGDVLLRWGAQRGLVLLPKSTNPERMAANLRCWDGAVALDSEDMAALDALTDPVESAKTFEAHFAKRAVVDPSNTTVNLGYATPPAAAAAAAAAAADGGGDGAAAAEGTCEDA